MNKNNISYSFDAENFFKEEKEENKFANISLDENKLNEKEVEEK